MTIIINGMKKLITLLILVMGFVGTANAGKLYIKITNQGWWGNDGAISAISFDDGMTKTDMNTVYMYGDKWAEQEIPTGFSSVRIWRHGGNNEYWDERSVTLNGTDNQYKNMSDGNLSDISAPVWNYLVFRQNIINWEGNNGTTWDDNDMHNTNHPDGDTFTFELTKTQIDASSNKEEGLRFRLRNSDYVAYDDAGNEVKGYPQIYPNSTTNGNGCQLNIGNNVTTYYQNTGSTDWYWQVDIPSFDYEKIVLTAKYVNENGYKWKISADAYLPAVNTNSYGYCTYVAPVALTIEGATAYYATDRGNGSARAVKMTNPAADTPMLIKGDANKAYDFKVAQTGTDNPGSTNAFKKGPVTGLTSGTTGPYNYILNGDAFYAANGKNVAKGKAYLQLSQQASARGALVFDNEETGIDVITATADKADACYNLNGQRIAAPSKGLYISNGRKVIMK